jgi:hypothetical protein
MFTQSNFEAKPIGSIHSAPGRHCCPRRGVLLRWCSTGRDVRCPRRTTSPLTLRGPRPPVSSRVAQVPEDAYPPHALQEAPRRGGCGMSELLIGRGKPFASHAPRAPTIARKFPRHASFSRVKCFPHARGECVPLPHALGWGPWLANGSPLGGKRSRCRTILVIF